MEAGQQDIGDAIVVEFENQLYSTQDRLRFHTELKNRIESEGARHVILDFTRARWFGAPILDELIVAAQMLREHDKELILVGSSKINRILNAARVDRVKLFANVQSALASFGRPVCVAA